MRHHLTNSPEHKTWVNMRSRCRDPRAQKYRYYGAKGIRVCERWDKSFLAFYEDMGPRPGPEYSIDRINPFGDYEPGNCQWATRAEQKINTRRARELGVKPAVRPRATEKDLTVR